MYIIFLCLLASLRLILHSILSMLLQLYDTQRSASPLVQPHNFMHSDDYLVLEDESGRVKLRGALLLPSVYVTGKIS